jgi:hypothetical protein
MHGNRDDKGVIELSVSQGLQWPKPCFEMTVRINVPLSARNVQVTFRR